MNFTSNMTLFEDNSSTTENTIYVGGEATPPFAFGVYTSANLDLENSSTDCSNPWNLRKWTDNSCALTPFPKYVFHVSVFAEFGVFGYDDFVPRTNSSVDKAHLGY